jgi:hypothetical protein
MDPERRRVDRGGSATGQQRTSSSEFRGCIITGIQVTDILGVGRKHHIGKDAVPPGRRERTAHIHGSRYDGGFFTQVGNLRGFGPQGWVRRKVSWS